MTVYRPFYEGFNLILFENYYFMNRVIISHARHYSIDIL